MISPVTQRPSMVHYHVMWSLFFGGKMERGGVGCREKSALKGESEGGKGILRVYASSGGGGVHGV